MCDLAVRILEVEVDSINFSNKTVFLRLRFERELKEFYDKLCDSTFNSAENLFF